MPVDKHDTKKINAIVRQVKTVRGSITYTINCEPAFDYAQSGHSCEVNGNEILFTAQNPDKTTLRLLADIPLKVRKQSGYAEFILNQSETVYFALECGCEQIEELNSIEFYKNNTYFETINLWRNWSNQSTYKGRWPEAVNRSAITLKLLTSSEHGSMVAAPTFSLPETLGGERNWDYRYTWIRDAAFTMYAFLRLGYTDEATAFFKWIHDRCKDDKLYLMYSIDGSHDLKETELKNFEGYKNSKPVLIGNAAQDQLQMDIYGELIDTIYIYNKQHSAITYEFWETIVKQIDEVIANWQKADHGIWEIRNLKKNFFTAGSCAGWQWTGLLKLQSTVHFHILKRSGVMSAMKYIWTFITISGMKK